MRRLTQWRNNKSNQHRGDPLPKFQTRDGGFRSINVGWWWWWGGEDGDGESGADQDHEKGEIRVAGRTEEEATSGGAK